MEEIGYASLTHLEDIPRMLAMCMHTRTIVPRLIHLVCTLLKLAATLMGCNPSCADRHIHVVVDTKGAKFSSVL